MPNVSTLCRPISPAPLQPAAADVIEHRRALRRPQRMIDLERHQHAGVTDRSRFVFNAIASRISSGTSCS
jgi:hypothetical protein